MRASRTSDGGREPRFLADFAEKQRSQLTGDAFWRRVRYPNMVHNEACMQAIQREIAKIRSENYAIRVKAGAPLSFA